MPVDTNKTICTIINNKFVKISKLYYLIIEFDRPLQRVRYLGKLLYLGLSTSDELKRLT